MAEFQNWIENHAGLITFQGNLAGIAQRNQILAGQIQQTALLREKITLERERAQQEANLAARQNLLYDTHQLATDISGRLESGSAQAYYELLLLNELLGRFNFDHRSFPSLEWKNFCTEALNYVQQLFGRARATLGEQTCQEVEQYRASELERQKFESERRAWSKAQKSKEEAKRKRRSALIIWSTVAIVISIAAAIGGIQYLYSDYRFIHSVRNRDSDAVTYLLRHGKDPNLLDDGQPLLIEALQVGNDGVARALIQGGADVNAKDGKGRPAILDYIESGDADQSDCLILRMLIARGADVNASDKKGGTSLSNAVEQLRIYPDYQKVVTLLQEHGATK